MKTMAMPFLTSLLILSSCGPSAEELRKSDEERVAKDKHLIDSTAKATAAQIQLNLQIQKEAEEKERIHRENQVKAQKAAEIRRIDEENLRDHIYNLESEIEIQRTKYNDLKSPKFLRTVKEKEDQLRAQLAIVRQLQQELENSMTQLSKLKSGKPYQMPLDYRSSDTTVAID